MHGDAVRRFYNYLSFGNKRTAYIYANHVRNFLDYVDKPLEEISSVDVTDWLAFLREGGHGDGGYCERTLHLCLCALRKFFKVMRMYEILDELPKEIIYEAPAPRWLEPEVAFKLIDRVPVLCVAYDLALRINEIGYLSTQTLNLETGDVEVTRLKHKGHPNKYMLKMDDWCLDVVRAYVKRFNIRGRLFPISTMTVNRIFRRRRNALGLDSGYKFHCLRHSRITHIAIRELEEKGTVDEVTLAKFAGHLRQETTRLYIHLAARHLAFKRAKS